MSEPPADREPAVAFFDVDQTLICGKSMFAFLAFFLRARGESEQESRRVAGDLSALAAGGAPREEVNRAYYRLYAGQSRQALSRLGASWFAEASANPAFWMPQTVREHRRLRERGVATVLVSGSFFACLDPIAAHLGARDVLGAPLEIRDGRLTGEVSRPMIGAGKAAAARDWLTRHDLSPEHCTAYGDHTSDLPLLELAGRPVVVGDHPEMARIAASRGWRRLAQPVPGRV